MWNIKFKILKLKFWLSEPFIHYGPGGRLWPEGGATNQITHLQGQRVINFHFQSASTSALAECDQMNQMKGTSLLSSPPHSWVTICLFVRPSLWGVCYARWARCPAGGSLAGYCATLQWSGIFLIPERFELETCYLYIMFFIPIMTEKLRDKVSSGRVCHKGLGCLV